MRTIHFTESHIQCTVSLYYGVSRTVVLCHHTVIVCHCTVECVTVLW